MRLKKEKQGLKQEVYERRKGRIRKPMDEFIDQGWKENHARRLQERLRRQREELLTLLDHEEVPPDNNAGERGIGPAVLIRKNSNSNDSEKGAQAQAILMTMLRTLKMRGHNPVQVLVDVLKSYGRSGQLLLLATKITAVG
jgi:transposase